MPSTHPPERRATLWTAGLLALLYAATSAPDVTWWDAGEFISAAQTLGIPHPPGTALYVIVARAWILVTGWMGSARAVNLLSAICTAAAAGIAAALMARATRSSFIGIAAALCAGTMSTVWLSATEAEVYGPSLLLAMLMLWAAERAGRTGESRYALLVAYLFALAAPLHVTALVAAPAAIMFAITRAREETSVEQVPAGPTGIRTIERTVLGQGAHVRWEVALGLGLSMLAAGGLGTGRWGLGCGAFVALIVVALIPRLRGGNSPVTPVALLIGFSAFAFLLLRARHDPGINQGNASTLASMMSVIARDQYAIAPLYPRQAPVWLQAVNFLEYADWQVALGLGPTVTPTVPRLLATMAFIVFGTIGSVAHRRLDRRSWNALTVLGLCGSIGVVAYLNLKAGPSIGYGIIPDDAPHEARERDYFFALAFWTWGLWAGVGAMAFAARWVGVERARVAVIAGMILAALPAALNVRVMNRRSEPEASLPLLLARELLEGSPERAVLLVYGDNDTYPLWYAQQVRGIRRDVVVVTYPLVSAGWYRDELYRRHALGTPSHPWRGMSDELAAIAASARAQARPLSAAVTVERKARHQFAPQWKLAGLVYLEVPDSLASGGTLPPGDPPIDGPIAELVAARLDRHLRQPLRPAIDPTARLMREALVCPSLALRAATDTAALRLLDSTCNYR
jgi:hypothetical protein